jgi:REP element-mobilizing transposase RayT
MSLIIPKPRKSFIQSNEIYFWTATINSWKHLLADDKFKNILIDSWAFLSEKKLIDVFGFVIMPNHFHAILQVNQMNGKESPQGSFLKYTAHQFEKLLLNESPFLLHQYRVNSSNKKHEFWQRDPLGVPIFTPEVAAQKLNYIHYNPVVKKWNLASKPEDYKYSSASYYKTGISEFTFLKNLWKILK